MSRFLTAALLSVALAGNAYSQSSTIVRVAGGVTHLTGREHEGQYYAVSVTHDVSSRFYLTGKAGYVRSVNRNWFTLPPPSGMDAWRDREHLVIDAGTGFHLLHFQMGQ